MASRADVDPSGRIIKLGAGGCPWRDHVFDLEKEMGLTDPDSNTILYVLVRRGQVTRLCLPAAHSLNTQ
jgi:hypothetical protein